jgi:hypothetical protein
MLSASSMHCWHPQEYWSRKQGDKSSSLAPKSRFKGNKFLSGIIALAAAVDGKPIDA